jgi:hypothetical protein
MLNLAAYYPAEVMSLPGGEGATAKWWPEFAAYLRGLRATYATGRWGTRSAARRAEAHGATGVNRNRLERAERGWWRDVDADFLRGVAIFYGRPYEEVAGVYLGERFSVRIVSHSSATAVVRSEDGRRSMSAPDSDSAPDTQQPEGDTPMPEREDRALKTLTVAFDLVKDLGPDQQYAFARHCLDVAMGWSQRPQDSQRASGEQRA